MHIGKLVFAQLMDHLPMQRFPSLRESLRWKSQDQIIHLSRPIPLYELRSTHIQRKPSGYRACLRAQQEKHDHLGFRGGISRKNLSNANKIRDFRIYADFAQSLIKIARPLYAKEDLGLDLDNTA